MRALARRASSSAACIVCGTISEYTWPSRPLRAISCAYWAPKSTTRTMSGASAAPPLSPAGERTELPSGIVQGWGLRGRHAAQAANLVGLLACLFLPPVGGNRHSLAHPHPGDPPAVQLGHGQLAARDLHRLALAGQVTERGEQVARYGLVRALG